jgi:hypothetical protein
VLKRPIVEETLKAGSQYNIGLGAEPTVLGHETQKTGSHYKRDELKYLAAAGIETLQVGSQCKIVAHEASSTSEKSGRPYYLCIVTVT